MSGEIYYSGNILCTNYDKIGILCPNPSYTSHQYNNDDKHRLSPKWVWFSDRNVYVTLLLKEFFFQVFYWVIFNLWCYIYFEIRILWASVEYCWFLLRSRWIFFWFFFLGSLFVYTFRLQSSTAVCMKVLAKIIFRVHRKFKCFIDVFLKMRKESK